MSPEMINGCLALQPLCISPSHSCKLVVTSFRVPVLSLTSSSDLMALSFIISWKRSKLLVPIGCSSNSLHRATSWGRSRCSSVSSSSNSLENRTMSFVWGCSPVPRTWNGKLRTHYFSKASSVRPQTRDRGSVTTLEQNSLLSFTSWTYLEKRCASSSDFALFLRAISAIVSCRNLASSSFAARPFFCFSSCRMTTIV